jgi:hypothetical protein
MEAAVIDRTQLSRIAERIWTEGRQNPVSWPVGTRVGVFRTDDRVAWRTEHGDWTAELRRSRGGRQVYLSVFHQGVYVGHYAALTGWRDATERSRVHRLRSRPLSLPLPLPLPLAG